MDDSTVAALAGLAGALIGAFAAVGAQALNNRHQEKLNRRREQRELIARFSIAADQVWRASQGLEHAVIGLEGARSGTDRTVHDLYEERRQSAFRSQHEGEVSAYNALSEMRVFYPTPAVPATLVLATSATYEIGKRQEQRAARVAAVREFESVASKMAADLPGWRWWQWRTRARTKSALRDALDDSHS